MGMVFLEMAEPKVYADSRFLSLQCLLFCQFKKTFTPEIPKFLGEMGQNRQKIAFDSVHSSKTALTDTEFIFLHYLGYYLHFELASAF